MDAVRAAPHLDAFQVGRQRVGRVVYELRAIGVGQQEILNDCLIGGAEDGEDERRGDASAVLAGAAVEVERRVAGREMPDERVQGRVVAHHGEVERTYYVLRPADALHARDGVGREVHLGPVGLVHAGDALVRSSVRKLVGMLVGLGRGAQAEHAAYAEGFDGAAFACAEAAEHRAAVQQPAPHPTPVARLDPAELADVPDGGEPVHVAGQRFDVHEVLSLSGREQGAREQ